MRILQICSARQLGGGERHLADLANGLALRSHEVFAALSPSSPLRPALGGLSTEKIIELPMRNALRLGSVSRLARFATEHRIQIIHAHVARDYPFAAMVARKSSAHLILTRHVLFPMNRAHKLALRRTDKVIAVSGAVAESLRAGGIFRDEKIALIYNGIDVDRFAKPERTASSDVADPNQKVRAGMIGHIAPIKGQEEFVRAAAIVCRQRPHVEFLIVGEDKSRRGEHRRNIENLILQLGLSSRVRLVGWVDDIAEIILQFDLFVSPARSEPFGLSIVEAMAAGVPVIATASEGAREIIEDHRTGLLTPVGDAEALAGAILKLLGNRDLRKSLGARAQQVVRKRFSLERMLDQTEEVYRGVLQ